MYYNFKDVLFAKKPRNKTEKSCNNRHSLVGSARDRMALIAKYGSNQKGNRTIIPTTWRRKSMAQSFGGAVNEYL